MRPLIRLSTLGVCGLLAVGCREATTAGSALPEIVARDIRTDFAVNVDLTRLSGHQANSA